MPANRLIGGWGRGGGEDIGGACIFTGFQSELRVGGVTGVEAWVVIRSLPLGFFFFFFFLGT